ncbi:hypothetical protein [Burkholderia stabilis]
MRQIKVMRKGAENRPIPDETGQLIGAETDGEAGGAAGEKPVKNRRKTGEKDRRKKTAAGQAAVFDEAL